MASLLKLSRCEGLVANRSCARSTLQVVELCIKAVKKAIRVGVSVVVEEGRAKDIDRRRINHAKSGFHGCARRGATLGELVKVEEVFHDDRLVIDGCERLNRER